MFFTDIAENSVIELLFVVFVGLAFGSFATALYYRIPRNIPWAMASGGEKKQKLERSCCPSCSHPLNARDLIPVLSWIIARGECRYCKAKIPFDYIAIECLTLIICLLVYTAYGLSLNFYFLALATPFLVTLLLIDLKYMILPNQLVLICGVIGLLKLLFIGIMLPSSWGALCWEYLWGAFIFSALIFTVGKAVKFILKKEALGFGDVKFMAVTGLWLGASAIGYFFILAGVIGVLFAASYKLLFRKEHATFPFGPSLIASFYIILLLQGFDVL